MVKGHQVASGKADDPRFPVGTIREQAPYFKSLGLNISEFYPGTLNAKFTGSSITLNHHDYFFSGVHWHKEMPAEDFKFCRCTILRGNEKYSALIYQPLLKTKTEHLQPLNQLEILAPYINNIKYGDILTLKIAEHSLSLAC